MQRRRIHVVKVPTRLDNLFPYSHYADEGHDPFLDPKIENDRLILVCEDLFKLKPNVQTSPRLRIDIYIPGQAALGLGVDIVEVFGPGNIAELANVNPEDFRRGPQTLPRIDEARKVRFAHASMSIAGFNISGGPGNVYIDRERPNEGHIEMQGPEVHLGLPLNPANIQGNLDMSLVQFIHVPTSEIRVRGETNPVKKAQGTLKLFFVPTQARDLASTLLHYGQQ